MATELKYSILNYMALNQDNYQEYKKLESLVEKVRFVEKLLTSHVSLFAEEMDSTFTHPLRVSITNIKSEKFIEYKGVFHLTFCLEFKSNLYIPEYIGIGKGVSVGFGIVRSKNVRDDD